MSGFTVLHLRRLFARPGRTLLSIAGVAVATALVVVRAWFNRPGASWYTISLRPNANRAAVRGALEKMVSDTGIPAFVGTGRERVVAALGAIKKLTASVESFRWVIAGAAALAILNTLLLAMAERRRELGVLRALGATRRRIQRAVVAESLGIGILGGILGLGLGALLHAALDSSMHLLVGFPMQYSLSVTPFLAAAVAALVVSSLGASAPAWWTGRLPVLETIAYE